MSTPRLTTLQNFLKDSPKDSFITFAIAKEYEKIGDKDKALAAYLELKENDPDYVGLYYHLGKLYEQFDEIETAFFTYKKGMEVAKAAGDQHAYNELAGAKLYLGDDDDFE
jgi:tetratricopeptide (TPR) repeat protein